MALISFRTSSSESSPSSPSTGRLCLRSIGHAVGQSRLPIVGQFEAKKALIIDAKQLRVSELGQSLDEPLLATNSYHSVSRYPIHF